MSQKNLDIFHVKAKRVPYLLLFSISVICDHCIHLQQPISCQWSLSILPENKNRGFLIFSGVIKRVQWREVG